MYRKRRWKRKMRRYPFRGIRVKQLRQPRSYLAPVNIRGVHYFKRTCLLNNDVGTCFYTSAGCVGGAQGNTINQQSTYDQWYLDTGNGAISTTTNYSIACNFKLNMLPDYDDFTSLFDQYKILGVKFKMVSWTDNAPSVSTGSTGLSCLCSTAIDYDDATAPTTTTSAGMKVMRQYENFKTHTFPSAKPISRYLRPRIAMAAYGGGVFTSYANKGAQWIDCSSVDVPHYGLKVFFTVQAPTSNSAYYLHFRPEITLYVACKNVR